MRRKPHGTDRAFHRKIGVRLTYQDHAGVGRQPHQPAKGAQRFGDPLVRLEVSEDADQRGDFVQPQFVPPAVAVALRESRRRGESRPPGLRIRLRAFRSP